MSNNNHIEALEMVAACAAASIIDLNANLADAYKEYMSGDIPRGAYEYVLHRHSALISALNAAGYTDICPIFGYPKKPSTLKASV